MSIFNFFWLALICCSGGIVYQDFKTRWISLWLLLLFSGVNIGLYLFANPMAQLFENAIFCTGYFLLCFLVLQMVYWMRTKQFTRIIDKKIGKADVIIFIAIGTTIEPITLPLFFTVGFILSLIIQIIFLGKNKQIPIAGIIVIIYLFFIFYKDISLLSSIFA